MQITEFVDSDHAGDKVTRRLRTGVLIYINCAPIICYYKKHNIIETSTFGSEFADLKVGVKIVQCLRYKLRMMGIPIEGAVNMRVNNMSVVNNKYTPESMLRKKSNYIAYDFVRECIVAGICLIRYEPTGSNLADALTKIQPVPVDQEIVHKVLWYSGSLWFWLVALPTYLLFSDRFIFKCEGTYICWVL